MKISVIVCTRNRASRLPRFLSAVASLQPVASGWELLIVDHASTDDTSQILEAFAGSTALPVRMLRTAVATLSEAKNEGIAGARGEICAFTDDDCYPQPDYLLALEEVFAAHDVGVVGGRVLRHDPTDANLSIQELDTPVDIEPRTFVRPGTMHGANMAMRREVLAAIGGFDPLLGPGTPCSTGEDIELVARAVWAGWRARYDPRVVVSHDHGRKPGPAADRVRFGYDYGRGAYFGKLLLNRQARGAYLRGWYNMMGRWPRALVRPRLRRELAGGRSYLLQRLRRGQTVPRFEVAPELTRSKGMP